MALFPAYAQPQDVTEMDVVEGTPPDPSEVVSPDRETLLLASDSDMDEERPARLSLSRRSSHNELFYCDTKSDYGNLRVSTLYYPGRPQYDLSAKPWLCGSGAGAPRRAARRYYLAPPPDAPAHLELQARTAAFRRMLADHPADAALWLRYIDFQEQWCDGESALRAAEEAAAAAGSRAPELLAARQRLRAAHLPRDAYLATLRDDLAAAQRSSSTDEVLSAWVRLAAALGAAATRAPPLAAAALQHLSHAPAAYPHLLYIHGATLRAAGLWEQLVLLVELVAAMNFPPAGFPPPHDEERARAADAALLDAEDKVTRSGLPLSAVWVRVERARAAAHWRPALARDPDPQRRPLPADVADLLLPVADDDAAFLLCVNLLRLAKVPLLPAAGFVSRACGAAGLVEEEVGGAWACDSAEALLPLLRAARRLPPAHPARPPHPHTARALLAHFLDPPHYFTDENGFLGWVTALWDACCAWSAGERRVALLCWRLRWLHALLLLLDTRDPAAQAEARRIRGEARAALKRHAADSPLPYAQFARIEREVAGEASGAAAAERALRAALADAECAAPARLYAARLAREAGGAAAAWALPCAVLGRALPSDAELQQCPRPDERVLRAALQHCEERCDELEARFGAEGAGGRGACAALLPGAAEWAGARVALASPARLAQLLRELPQRLEAARSSAEGRRYYEQGACALAAARVAGAAHALAPLFPHNALLTLASAGTPLWARQSGATGDLRVAELAQPARSHAAALALVLPALLRAAAATWPPRLAERVRAAAARAGRRGCGGALLAAAALEGAARGERPAAAPRALLAALDLHPDHKWLYVRGAAWVCAEAEALGDVVLERQLRLHALRDELAAAAPLH